MNVPKALALMKSKGIPESQALEILSLAVAELRKAEADRRNCTTEELDGFDTGKEIGAKLNAKLGLGRKGR